jgi:RNA polymerase sigma factor (sigma-70 family)
MVLRVCHGILHNEADAMDAFQATFLVLARQGGRLWVADSLGPWLHRVACRAACRARVLAERRKAHEQRAAKQAPAPAAAPASDQDDRAAILHEELDRLPERYRVPIVLCDLEGRTCEEAASYLGCPVGTVKCWRSRGRRRLRTQLARRGLGALPLPAASLRLPPLASPAIASLARMATEPPAAGTVPAAVSRLTEGVLRSMLYAKLRTAAVAVALGLLAASAGVLADPLEDPRAHQAAPPAPAARKDPPHAIAPATAALKPGAFEDQQWPLTLSEAIYYGIERSGVARVLVDFHGSPPAADSRNRARSRVVVGWSSAPPKEGDWKQRARLMQIVRSVEERYWDLAQQYDQLRASEKAVEFAKTLKDREQSELESGRGTVADVAEATQRLEQFQLDLITKTSDVRTEERNLRSLLAMPAVDDDRLLVPVTEPREAEFRPDWNAAHAQMLAHHPEIALLRERIRGAGTDLGAGNPLQQAAAIAARKDTSPELRRELISLESLVHWTTHDLARRFLELEASSKQFAKASRLRVAATQRLEAQRAFYEEGRITIDRYLDAASQYASALAQAARFRAAYNVAIVALEEAEGTLRAYDNITIADSQGRVGPDEPSPSPAPASVPAAAPAPSAVPAPAAPIASVKWAGSPAPRADGGKQMEFDFTIDLIRPVRVRGTLRITPTEEPAP